MKSFKNQNLKDMALDLDQIFLDTCVLSNCDLFYSGGDFEFQNASFENCRFHFRGAARNAQMMFQMIGLLKQVTPQTNLPSLSTKSVN